MLKPSERSPYTLFDAVTRIIAVGLALYFAVISTLTYYRVPKLGYVDLGVLLEKYGPAIEAKEKIKQQTEEWRKNINTLEAELAEGKKEFVEKGETWDKDTATEKRKAFAEKQSEYLRYNRSITEKANQFEKELMQPVFNALNVSIRSFGRERKFHMIFGTLPGGNILYAHSASNLTLDFLSYLEKKENKDSKTK